MRLIEDAMTLRKKILFTMGVMIISLIVILYFAAQGILLSNFTELERRNTAQNVERLLSTLSNEFSNLEAQTSDRAAGDDTYAFMQDVNEAYLRSNLVDETFVHLKINVMLFVDPLGQIVYGKAFDLVDNKEVPLPQGIKEHLAANSPLVKHQDVSSSVSGFLLLPENPVLISSRPILTSKEEGPIRGALIMGRYLDATEVKRLSGVAHLSLSTERFDDPQSPPDFRQASVSLSEERPVFVQPLDEQSIAGYALLKDIYGKPALIARSEMPRDIYQEGRTTTIYLLISVIVVGLEFGIVTLLLLEKQVLARLNRLSRSVGSIGAGGSSATRVLVEGRDELAHLAVSINGMLSVLQQAEDKIQKLYQLEKELRQELQVEMDRRVEFTRALVHELKTPLTPVMASSELLVEELKEGTLLRLAKNVHRGAIELDRRIDELLDLAKGEIGMLKLSLQPVDPLKLLHEAVANMTPVASNRKQTLRSFLPPSLPVMMADGERLRQVVLNLVGNAIKFTPQGGEIRLSAREEEGNLIVEVQDTGIGIDEEEQKRLFQAYHRLERDRERLSGLGLGLALSKRLVELHGGEIWVKSKRGAGSTFAFSVPIRSKGQTDGSARARGG
ncbi:MAG: CHASE4 domain-containing protein [Dehalococcoidia bacterium]|nr:CHASE4 domain-containing protein [Dehalococcoidia bacterium]